MPPQSFARWGQTMPILPIYLLGFRDGSSTSPTGTPGEPLWTGEDYPPTHHDPRQVEGAEVEEAEEAEEAEEGHSLSQDTHLLPILKNS